MIKKIFVLIFAMTLVLTGCQKSNTSGLSTPELTILEQTASSFTVSWNVVEGADEYVYTLNGGGENTTAQTIVTYNDLETSIYTLAVKAVNDNAQSEWAQIEVVLVPSSEDGFAVQINAKDVTASTATVEFIPSNNETQYFARVITSAELENLTITTDEQLIQYLYENPNQADYVYTGVQTMNLDKLSPNYEYLAVAFEYLAPEEIKTIYKKTFITLDGTVDHSMTITNLTPDYTGVTFDVTPGNDQEYWYYYCMEKSLYDEFGTDVMIYTYYGLQNLSFEMGYSSGMGEMLQACAMQGPGQVVATGLKHSTEYVAMAFFVDPSSTDPTDIYDWNYVYEEFSTLEPSSDAPVVTIGEPVVVYEGGAYKISINVKVDPSTTTLSYGSAAFSSVEGYYDQIPVEGWSVIKAFFWLKAVSDEQLEQAKSSGGLDFVYEGVEAGDYVFLYEAVNAQGVYTYEGVRVGPSYF
ncbi:MAG: hypothetical protein IKC17_01230 [Bacteroidales bacterium]|nr:hypothetical protein [Bacteroidales bacterium]